MTTRATAAEIDTRTDVMIECTDVSKTYGSGPAAVVAVQGTTCRVGHHARVAIVGPSGSGKSTLLYLLAGLEKPTRGTVTTRLPQRDHASAIGVVFQGPSLVPSLTVGENVSLPLALAGLPETEWPGFVDVALTVVVGRDWCDRLPEELSAGQAQRVAIARALVSRPMVILADEPTGQLDHDTGQRVMDALVAAADALGAALVVSTHDPSMAARMTDTWTMHEGRLTGMETS